MAQLHYKPGLNLTFRAGIACFSPFVADQWWNRRSWDGSEREFTVEHHFRTSSDSHFPSVLAKRWERGGPAPSVCRPVKRVVFPPRGRENGNV